MAVERNIELDEGGQSARDRVARRLSPGTPVAPAGRRYTRFVGFMKVFLPLLASVIVAALAIWPMLREDGEPVVAELEKQPDVLQVTGPLLVGTDLNNRPYSIAATRAQQGPEGPHIVELSDPEGTLTGRDGTVLSLLAKSGRYDRDAERLFLEGDVRIWRDDGHSFATDEVYIDMDGHRAWGDRPVLADGPAGQIRGEGFRIEDEGATVIFTGPSRAILTGPLDADPSDTAPRGDTP